MRSGGGADADLAEQWLDRRRWYRIGEDIALDPFAAERAHQRELLGRLHALRHGSHAQAPRERDDGADDGAAFGVVLACRLNEAAVDLDRVEAAVAQIARCRVTRADRKSKRLNYSH